MTIELLSELLRDLLRENDRVYLPGMGTFFAEVMPASITDGGNKIKPAYKKVYFRGTERWNDGLLESNYAQRTSLELDVAKKKIEIFTEGLIEELNQKKSMEFPGFGIMRATDEKNYFFVPDPDLDLYGDAFGLEPISLKKIRSSDVGSDREERGERGERREEKGEERREGRGEKRKMEGDRKKEKGGRKKEVASKGLAMTDRDWEIERRMKEEEERELMGVLATEDNKTGGRRKEEIASQRLTMTKREEEDRRERERKERLERDLMKMREEKEEENRREEEKRRRVAEKREREEIERREKMERELEEVRRAKEEKKRVEEEKRRKKEERKMDKINRRRRRRKLRKGEVVALSLSIILVVVVLAFFLLVYFENPIIDRLLYTPEDLRFVAP